MISFMCAWKGGCEDLTREILRHFVSYAFVNPVILHCEKEMSIRDVCTKVARERKARIVLRSCQKQVISAMVLLKQHTHTCKDKQKSFRTLVCSFQQHHPQFHYSWLRTVRQDERTPLQYLLGAPCASTLCVFGESVFPVIPDHSGSGQTRVCWWRRDASSDEHLVGTKFGLLKCRPVPRKPPGEYVEMDTGVPEPVEPRRQTEIPTVLPLVPPPQQDSQKPEIHGQGVRGSEVDRTPGCHACETASLGKSHTRECKTFPDALGGESTNRNSGGGATWSRSGSGHTTIGPEFKLIGSRPEKIETHRHDRRREPGRLDG